MDQIWHRIEAWLVANAAPIADGLNAPASKDEIAETEKLLGVEFPEDVRATYLRHDGQSHNSPWLLEGWEWLALERIRSEWQVWKNLLDVGDFDGIQSDGEGEIVNNDWWNAAWIPLTHSGSGDHHCLDLAPGPEGSHGQIIEMWHDDAIRPVIANSFTEWLTDFADALEADEFVLSDEYGCLCRREEL